MDHGNSEPEGVKDVSASNPGFTAAGAANFTAIAVSTYCPQDVGVPTPPGQLPLPPTEFWPEFPLPTFNF